MSNPKNILDAYRSYAYHHILVACDSSSAAEALARESDITLFDIDSDSQVRYQPQTVPGREAEGQYVVLINGAADATFYISTAQWTTVMTSDPNTSEQMSYHTSMIEGTMTVVEPKGVRFLNTIVEAGRQMNVDAKGMVFLLKTIFTGYRSDGGRDLITTVDPLLFTVIDISADFSITGATYAVAFAGAVDGTGYLPEVSAVSDGFTFQLQQSEPRNISDIESAMAALEDELNDRYQKFKKKLKEETDCPQFNIDWDDEFIDVEYRIRVDDEYKEMEVGTNHKFLQKEFGEKDSIIVDDGEILSIEKIIEAVMMSSREVVISDNPSREADFTRAQEFEGVAGPGAGGAAFQFGRDIEEEAEEDEEEAENKQKYTFKIHSTLDSTNEKYFVTYHIKRYPIPTNVRNSQGQTFFAAPPAGQRVEFDYIFTGQNVDILDFEIKMNMGLAFYHILSSTDSIPNARQMTGYKIDQALASGTGEFNSISSSVPDKDEDEQAKKPLFLGTSVRAARMRNRQSSREVISYNAMLSRFAGLESVNTTVTIRGNPQLLAESSPLPSRLLNDESVPVVLTETAREMDDAFSEATNTIIPQMWRQPAGARINIRMPALNDNDPDYSEPFWYRGWFYIREVENSFEDGQFTQVLSLNAFPTDTLNQMAYGKDNCTDDDEEQEPVSPEEQAERLPAGARRDQVNRAVSRSEFKEEKTVDESKVDITNEGRRKQQGPGAGR